MVSQAGNIVLERFGFYIAVAIRRLWKDLEYSIKR